MEIFWKQERACHKFSCIEAFCTVLVCTAGRKSFVLGCLDTKVSSSSRIMPADEAASFLGTSSFVVMIFFKNWFIWSSLAKLRFAFKGFDMSTFMSAVGENWEKKCVIYSAIIQAVGKYKALNGNSFSIIYQPCFITRMNQC